MRARIIAVLLPLLVVLTAAIAIPAGIAMAQRHSSEMLGDRILDASRFASLAQAGMEGSPDRITRELDDYSDLYDSPVHVIGREGETIHSTTSDTVPTSIREAATPALAGRAPVADRLITPFGPDRVTIATPVGHDSQVVGAVIIEAPTDTVRSAILQDWVLVLIAAIVPLILVLLALGPVTDWVLRPLARLEATLTRMRRGSMGLRADDSAGPPELRGVARSFNSFADAVSATYERQQRFTADASHQLRNPLASLRVAIDNLEPVTADDPEDREIHAEAVETVERMDTVVSDLLLATQHTARATETAVSLAEVPVDGWRETVGRYNANLRVELPALVVIEPSGGFESLIGELVDNAVRLGQARNVEVQATGTSAEEFVTLRVDDDGIGMTRAERTRAIDRLWRSPRVQNVAGTGLGLSIVSHGVEETGGTLTLGFSPTGGLRVEIMLRTASPQSNPR